MVIGIDASRAFLKRRTGIEEYAYQVVKHLRHKLRDESVVLYIRRGYTIDFDVPLSWSVKELWAPRLWTQVRLSWELFWHAPDILFVPAHTVPIVHPRRTIVVIHGLEYEFCPDAYSWWDRWYMRISIWCSVRWASEVVCVSENTRRDVVQLYNASTTKISVIGEGYNETVSSRPPSRDPDCIELNATQPGSRVKPGMTMQIQAIAKSIKPYFLFIGRIEERKNISRIIAAFDIFKKETQLPHILVLAGKAGYGYATIEKSKNQSEYKKDITELGYVSEEEKWGLLKNAEAFLFPTLYEGFGIPILEAQSIGTAVITSNTSSLPEVAGTGAVLIDPENTQELARAMKRLVSEPELKSGIIARGRENVGRYSWDNCANELTELLICRKVKND